MKHHIKQGEIIWVPSQFLPRKISQDKYWPAQFKKMMNINHIGMVSLFSYEDDQQFFRQQIIVEITQIKKFEDYLPHEMSKFCKKAYEKANDVQKSYVIGFKQIKIHRISSSKQFVNILQNAYKHICVASTLQNKHQQILPQFLIENIPLQPTDLKIYFDNQVPQLILYLLENLNTQKLNKSTKNLETWRKQIVDGILDGVRHNTVILSEYKMY